MKNTNNRTLAGSAETCELLKEQQCPHQVFDGVTIMAVVMSSVVLYCAEFFSSYQPRQFDIQLFGDSLYVHH
jgi:hypothetical protein